MQSSRNAYLMKVLEDLPPPGESRPLCENRGTGLTAMIEQLRRSGMSPPRFDVSLTRFRVVLPNHTLYDEATLRWLEELARGEPVSGAQRQALAFVRHNGSLTNGDYCRVTGSDSRVATREVAAKLGLSASCVRYWLSRLRRAGRVESSGRTPTSPENRYSAVDTDLTRQA